MKSSFQRRLFRLLLVFSVVPAVLLALVGYYLMSETTPPPADTSSGITAVTDYYNNFLFQRIEQSLRSYVQSGPTGSDGLDFLFESKDGQVSAITGHTLVNPAIANQILSAAGVHRTGFLETQQQTYQFVCTEDASGRRVCGGFLHGTSFRIMQARVRERTAAQGLTRRLRSEYVLFAASVLGILAILTIIAAYLFSSRQSRQLTRPLRDLTEASRKIAQGDFRQQVRPAGDADIRNLIENFNRMAVQLDETTARLAQSERVAAWRQVARRFAHELKNPLQPILVSLYRIEKLLMDTAAYEHVYEPLKAAADEVKHLNSLAERFSHLAKLPPPSLEETDLNALLRSMAGLYREQLANRQFRLLLSEKSTLCKVDLAYLREALYNLLQNAIDATGPGGKITVALSESEERVRITVSDTGIGMDPATISRARLPYFTTKKMGTGLGLAIVEKSVEEMGGQLLVASRPGQGSTIEIILPKET
jgi:two-component system nitrogen regulation sensor histidine kinase NtrY